MKKIEMFRVVSVCSTTPPTMIEPSEITKAVETIGTAGVVSTGSTTPRQAVEPVEETEAVEPVETAVVVEPTGTTEAVEPVETASLNVFEPAETTPIEETHANTNL